MAHKDCSQNSLVSCLNLDVIIFILELLRGLFCVLDSRCKYSIKKLIPSAHTTYRVLQWPPFWYCGSYEPVMYRVHTWELCNQVTKKKQKNHTQKFKLLLGCRIQEWPSMSSGIWQVYVEKYIKTCMQQQAMQRWHHEKCQKWWTTSPKWLKS